ncbi:MAG: hypothetical protein PVG96_03470 [Desulfobacterales bacterium]|jgi:hypothetical protein
MKPKRLKNPVVDPVCGMSVDPGTATIKVFIEGQADEMPLMRFLCAILPNLTRYVI